MRTVEKKGLESASASLMKEITLSEVINKGKRIGIEISPRTVRRWTALGLLPKPRIEYKGPGNVKGYYDSNILEMIKLVMEMRGKALSEIKEILSRDFRDPVIEIIEYQGYPPLEVVSIQETISSNGRIWMLKKLRDGGTLIQSKLKGGI